VKFRQWILDWLGGVTSEEVNRRRNIDSKQRVDDLDAATKAFNRTLQQRKLEHERELEELKKEHAKEIAKLKADVEALSNRADAIADAPQAAIADVIAELNELRNKMPAVIASQEPKPGVRVMRNFRDFRSVMEGRPQQPIPIKIERMS